ncbi:MAG: adenylate/guanylate cyclase domain-containing protein [Chitinophagales bacterium]
MSQSRQLAAIMFTDIVGYTALMGNDEQNAFAILNKNRALQKPIIEKYNGRWIKELGDGVMASFNTVSDAVNAAIKIQEGCNAAKNFQLRIGIHQGEVVFENDDVFGDGVNIASRIQSAAKPGTIYVSESVHHNVSNKKNIQTKFIKEETLKNVKEPVRIYEIVIVNETISTSENKMKTTSQNSIAVLPFANMSSDPEQEYFSDGISEEIINMLAQVPGLKVAGRTSAFSFKGKNQDLREIGEKLNVNHILEGSVRKSGNKLRITAQLIKVADGYHLWSEKYDRQLEDIFDIQDEIALAILNAIKIKLLAEEKEVVLKRYTDNTEAYELYLRGRSFITEFSAEPIFKALKYFEAAIKIEPEYALAYTGIAYCYLILWFFNHLPPQESLPGMLKAAGRSLELDDEISETYTAIARVKLYYEWDLKGAAIEFQKAIKLNPNMAESREHYAFCLATLGNKKEAIEQAEIAHSVDPLSLITNFDVASLYWCVGSAEKQLKIGRNMIAMEPNFWGGHRMVADALMSLKRYEESVIEAELAVTKSYDCFTLMYLGLLYGVMGEKTKAREVLVKMKELTKDQSAYYYMAVLYMAFGEFDNALAYFEKAIEKREGYLVYVKFHIRYFPEFKQDPRTKILFEKAGVLLD